ncbi:MAG: molybdopterin-dependent oxidoreductase, partial [Actinomycetota bacterium]
RMAGRRTNLALLVLLALALATGIGAYAIGTAWVRWILVAHGVVAIAIIALGPWKSVIARRGLRRHRPGRAASVVFSVTIVVALLTGFSHSTGVLRSLGPVTAMQVHVGAAIVAIPLALWHIVARRVRFHHTDLARRQMLRAGALLGGAGVSYALLELAPLPGRDRRVTGSHEEGSFDQDLMPVTQWFDDSVPQLDLTEWRLRVGDRSFGYDELAAYSDEVEAVIDCTGGWWARQRWEGVRLARLLPSLDSRSIAVVSVTGYGRLFPARDIDDLLVATRIGGERLTAGHGFPARLVAPGRRGFWWVKWIDEIRAEDRPWWLQSPFPLT